MGESIDKQLILRSDNMSEHKQTPQKFFIIPFAVFNEYGGGVLL